MVRPVVMVGLDAFDPGLARGWAAAGELPTLARLLEGGAHCTVRNPFGLFVGALWTSFAAAMRPSRTRFHCWDEIDPATYRWRLCPPKPELYAPFWRRIGEAGRRVAAVDVPHARAEPLNGIELFEWGCHDRHYGLHGFPAALAGEAAERFGFHPVLGMQGWRERHFSPDDFYARKGRFRTPAEEGKLVRAMAAGVESKGALLRALQARENWDLFLAVFGESHAIGHQQWHLHDESHPRFDEAARAAAGGDPILRVYRAIDAELGRLLARAPADAAILVHLSHGMTGHHDGTHLLDEVLARLEGRDFRQSVKPALPALRHVADRLGLPVGWRSRLAAAVRGDPPRAGRRFFASPNNCVYGGIRFNLAGREPDGRVAPEEVETLARELELELRALVNLKTGGPVVLAVHRCSEHYPRAADDRMPDLFVEWERSAPIEAVASPGVGTLVAPYTHWRTGDHEADGLLIAVAPDLPAGAEMSPLAIEDLGPSVAARLGVALGGVDGSAAPWLAATEPLAA
jgi:predicted AlkP superfamily phosphohydrolase/phosphomutase